MPLRFLTNFRLLQLSICMAGKGKIWVSGYLCFLSAPVASAVLSFCPLFSSASEHNDETTSVASVQVTGPSASSVVCPPRSSYLDLFWSGFADFLRLCLDVFFTIRRLFLQLPQNQLKSDIVVQAYLGSEEKAIWWLQRVATGAAWDISPILDGSKRLCLLFLFMPSPTCKDATPLRSAGGVTVISHTIHLNSIHTTFAGCQGAQCVCIEHREHTTQRHTDIWVFVVAAIKWMSWPIEASQKMSNLLCVVDLLRDMRWDEMR